MRAWPCLLSCKLLWQHAFGESLLEGGMQTVAHGEGGACKRPSRSDTVVDKVGCQLHAILHAFAAA
jgi:hypothetical protein